MLAGRRPLIAVALLSLPLAPLAAQQVAELYVSPDTLNLGVGQKEGLSVQAFDNVGNAILQIRYRSTDDRIARVQPQGTVTGVKPGSARVIVSAGKKTHTVVVLVGDAGGFGPPVPASPAPETGTHGTASPPAPGPTVPDVAGLAIQPAAVYLLPTEHVRLSIRALRADGSEVPGIAARWKALRPEVATVGDTSGIVTGEATGQGVIQAIAPGGVSTTVPVYVALTEFEPSPARLVLAPGDTAGAHLVVPGQQHRPLRNSDLQWRALDTTIAAVSGDGVIHARAPGSTEVVATGFLQERRVAVVVHREVATFATRPRLGETVQLPLHTAREFMVRAEAADSTPIAEVEFAWQVADTTVAVFDPATRRLQARKLGQTTLSFVARGFAPKSWTVRVVPGRLGVAPSRQALSAGERLTLAATYLDDDGKPAGEASEVSWASATPGVAVVDETGTVRAVSPGRSTVTGTVPTGQSASAAVFVVPELIFSSTRTGRFGVYGLNLTAPDRFVPILADSGSNNLQASYSPDRTRIAFSSDRSGSGNYDIYVADADGQHPVRLTTDPQLESQPVWTPDGAHIVFVSARAGTNQLYIMRADGSEVRQLTRLPGGALEPAVAPDGSMVAFASFPNGREGSADIYTVSLGGGEPLNVTGSRESSERAPSFFPNGELAWSVDRKEGRERYQIVRIVGGAPTVVASSELPLAGFAVAPDGQALAWVGTRVTDRDRGTMEVQFAVRPAAGAPVLVRLNPNERIASPDF